MPTERIPITPVVLKWARERAGYSRDDIRQQFPAIEDWEEGSLSPTYNQLETLSDKFKCPVAVFFFPEPPQVPRIEQSFRTLPASELDNMPHPIRILLRKAKAMQLNLIELHEARNPSERLITRDLQPSITDTVEDIASNVRSYLSITLEKQMSWQSIDQAFEYWRSALTSHGIYVFKDAFKNENFSGFCLYDDQFPVIFVNNSTTKTRQIFTLFHELAHLLFRTSGIDKTNEDAFINTLTHNEKQIEIFCNRFSAAFLVPDDDFFRLIKGLAPDENKISFWATRYKVSREVILRKLLEAGLVTQEFYEQKSEEWAAQTKPQGAGGDYYLTQIAYLGRQYIDVALKKYHQSKIDDTQLGDYLNIKPKNIEKFEDKFSGGSV